MCTWLYSRCNATLVLLLLLLAVVSIVLAVFVFVGWFDLKPGISAGHLMQMESKTNYTAAVIYLHGLGGTGNGYKRFFANIRQSHIKYIFPTAPIMPVTFRRGKRMRSWFNLFGLNSTSNEDEKSIKAAADLLQSIIAKQENLGIKRDRIVVGGLSQGGATTLYSLLSISQAPVAGIIGLSTWLPLHKTFPKAAKANFETPVLLCHGDSDQIVSLEFGRLTAEKLKAFNKNVEFKIYPGLGHRVIDEEKKAIEPFINKCLPDVGK